MEIHRYEKVWGVASVILILAFIGTVTWGAVGGPAITMVNDEGGTVDPANLENTEFADPGVERVGPDEYEVHVVARQFQFDPDPIEVPADSTVTFYITSSDVVHGFEVVGTNVNVMVIPGQVSKITVEFDDPGTYGVVCHEYCGSGHHEMAGTLEVVPQSQFEAPDEAANVESGSNDDGSNADGSLVAVGAGGESP